jgi:hypothetical protein
MDPTLQEELAELEQRHADDSDALETIREWMFESEKFAALSEKKSEDSDGNTDN